jgi:hydroxypyruvate isomerase
MSAYLNGLIDLPWWGYVVVTLALTHITIASVTIFLHRAQAHRALDLHPLVSHFFRFWLWFTTATVTKAWVAIHRKHHAKCETPEDPHSPQIFGIKKVLWQGAELYRAEAKVQATLDRYGHGTPDDWLERKLYTPHTFSGIFILLALQLVLFNVDADSLLQGGEGLAAVPEKQTQFKQAVDQALHYAEFLQPALINVLPGRCFDPARLEAYQQTLLENLQYAAQAFAEIGVTTVFEAVNSQDMPGFIVDNAQKMLSILAELKNPNLRLQFDIYHMTRMQEDCAAFIRQHSDKIGHFQFADCPGRGEPGTGEVKFAELFELISSLAYQGWVGAEYKPVIGTHPSLDWLKTYQA